MAPQIGLYRGCPAGDDHQVVDACWINSLFCKPAFDGLCFIWNGSIAEMGQRFCEIGELPSGSERKL